MSHFTCAEDFADHLLNCYFNDIRTTVSGNYDVERFNYGGVDRSDIPYDALHEAAFKEILRKTEPLYHSYCLLEDKDEKNLYIDLLRYRMAGHKHVKLPTNNDEYWKIHQKSLQLNYVTSIFDFYNSLSMRPVSFEVEWFGHMLRVISMGAGWPFFHPQYFYNKNGIAIQPENGDHVVDAGSCLGDTALAFGAAVGGAGYVYLFDLFESHHKIAHHNIENNANISRFKLFAQGLSDTLYAPSKALALPDRFEPGFEMPEDNMDFATTTLDHMVESGQIERVDFIKMDIEGAEMKALRGSVETLRRFRPKLAISIYHKISDFHEVPLFIKSLDLGYRLYLDHYTIHAGETVLYAKASA